MAHQSYWREGAGYVTRGGWGVEQQHVNYRRYIRFLPGKRLFIYCSPDPPRQVLQKVMGQDFARLGGLIGSWSFTDDNMHICAIVGNGFEKQFLSFNVLLTDNVFNRIKNEFQSGLTKSTSLSLCGECKNGVND